MPTKNVTWEQIENKVAAIGAAAGVPDVGLYRILVDGVTGKQSCIELNVNNTNYAAPGFDNKISYYLIGPRAKHLPNEGITSSHFTGFNMRAFPGCCALCISTGAFVRVDYHRRGINKLGIQLRELLAAFAGYTGLICTDKANNEASIRTIEGAGFQRLYSLRNRRTRNQVNLYIKDLDK